MKRHSKSVCKGNERSAVHISSNKTQMPPKDNNAKPSYLEQFCSTISFLKYILLVLLVPPILNKAALHREFEVLQPEGERVHMGWGQKMFISCKGEGLPTVILDAPTGSSSDIWLTAQKEITKFTQVCIYDRSGLGFSDHPFGYFSAFNDGTVDKDSDSARRFVAEPSSIKQMVKDLYHLLTVAKPIPRPFILVGSEVSSLSARYFAQMYPREVTGIILIDPMVENMLMEEEDPWSKYWNHDILPYLQPLHLSALCGISRLALLTGWLKPELNSTSEEVILRQKYMLCNPSHMLTIYNEHFLMNMSLFQMREIRHSNSFPSNISVTVLNSNYINLNLQDLNKAWKKHQKYLREDLHPGCQHQDMGETSRNEFFSHPRVIVDHVKKLVYESRKNVFQSHKL